MKHYASEDDGEKDIRTSHLVAEFKPLKPIKKENFPLIEDDFENFLRLTSFACRFPCMCRGWEYSSGSQVIQHQFFNKSFPSDEGLGMNHTLIDVSIFPKFIRRVYPRFHLLQNRELLDGAIYALIRDRATVEDAYTRLFSGIQSVLWFSYRNGGGSKNRVPIKMLFEGFSTFYQVDLRDLWPLFDATDGVSLYEVRNDIAHGEFLSPDKLRILSIARENLALTLERLLLTVLGAC